MALSFCTRGGYEISSPDGSDRIIVKKGGLHVFEIEMGGIGMKIQSAGDLLIEAGGSISIKAGREMNLAGGSGVVVTSGQNIAMTSTSNMNLTAGGTWNAIGSHVIHLKTNSQMKLDVGRSVAINAGEEFTTRCKKASIQSSTDVNIDAKDITIRGSGKINVKADGDVTIKGSKILQN